MVMLEERKIGAYGLFATVDFLNNIALLKTYPWFDFSSIFVQWNISSTFLKLPKCQFELYVPLILIHQQVPIKTI